MAIRPGTRKGLLIMGGAYFSEPPHYRRPINEGGQGAWAPLNYPPEQLARQKLEPIAVVPWTPTGHGFIFRDIVVQAHFGQLRAEGVSSGSDLTLLIKHVVLSREREFQRIQREVDAFENAETLIAHPRQPIPSDVRLFVWQRDQGRCASCGGKELLEYDHIIPVAEGGSSTARNIQLLCEGCNKAKGRRIL